MLQTSAGDVQKPTCIDVVKRKYRFKKAQRDLKTVLLPVYVYKKLAYALGRK